MFVRWKRRERVSRKRKRVRRTGQFLLVAVLVRSERRDGRPRQKVVGYLGSIAEDAVEETLPRVNFWRDVEQRLAALDLDQALRQGVEASLLARIKRPTAEEITAAEESFRALLRSAMGSGRG